MWLGLKQVVGLRGPNIGTSCCLCSHSPFPGLLFQKRWGRHLWQGLAPDCMGHHKDHSPPTTDLDIKVTDDEDEDLWVSAQVPPLPAGGIQQEPQIDSHVFPQEDRMTKVMPLEEEQSNL